jgi:uroporphyrinogen-III synthase
MGMARQSDLSTGHGEVLPVLVTRPRDQAERFAQALIGRFGSRVQPLVAPLMQTRFLSPPLPERTFAAVIFTSVHGVEGAMRLPVPWPRRAYCVGQATAAAATRAGFAARSADGDAAALAKAILSEPPEGPLLYLRGVDTAGDLDTLLISHNIQLLSLQVYLQAAIPFEGESIDLLRHAGPLIVPLFSPRSAVLFRKAIPEDTRADLRFAVMSAAVAAEASKVPHGILIVAVRPDASAMLDAVESLLVPSPPP